MPTREAEAVVLRQYSLSEADRIVVLVTREYGKVRAVGQGIKRPKSRWAAALEPLNHIRVQFYAREGAELHRIRQCETIHSYLGRRSSLEKFFAYNYFAEIINEFIQENHPNDRLFRLFLTTMNAGESVGIDASLVRYFEFWTLKLNGLLPDYGRCAGCGKCVNDVGFYARAESGQGYCPECAREKGIRIGPEAVQLLGSVLELSPEKFSSRVFPKEAVRDLKILARKLLELHLEKRLKSYEPLQEILRDA